MRPKRESRTPGAATGYAVVWCHDFRLQALRRHAECQGPIALVDDAARQSIVLCANAAARRDGVAVGMPVVQALARCPGLQVDRPSEAAELAAGRFLLESVFAWVPGVEETAPGILTLDLSSQPQERWFESAWKLRERLADRGLEIVIGLGETPALARLAAQAALHEDVAIWHLPPDGRLERLDRLPVLLAETGAALRETLALWGIRTLGAFARLRRDGVAARLGAEGVELWLRLNGRLRRPLRLVKLEDLFEVHHDFELAVVEFDPLAYLLRRFLGELADRVARTGRVASAVHLLVNFADGACHGRRLVPPEPTLDEEVLFRLAAGHLATVEMRAAVESIRLRLETADPLASQRPLFGAGLRNPLRCGDTLTKLRKIVGAERVGSPRAVESRRPGTFECAPLLGNLGEGGEVSFGPPVSGPILRKFPVACRATVQMREGQPLRVETARFSGVVGACSGPWKSSGDWWHQGRGWERTEWDVELLHHGLFRLVETQRGWSVEGYYD